MAMAVEKKWLTNEEAKMATKTMVSQVGVEAFAAEKEGFQDKEETEEVKDPIEEVGNEE